MADSQVPFRLDPERAALLVVDMQNDFVRRGAPMYLEGCSRAVPNVRSVLEACRAAGVPVVFLKFTAGPQETLIWAWSPKLRPADKCCWKGHSRFYPDIGREAPGHEVIEELAPRPGEEIVEKYSYGGFHETNLQAVLLARRVEQLIVVGCAAPFCIDDTVTGAFDRQYRVVVVSDAIGYFDEEFHRNSLRRFAMKYGRVLGTAELLAELQETVRGA